MQAAKRRNGAIELDLGRYELRRHGRRVKLEKKPMEPLIFMVSRREQLVSRKDIVTKLWRSNLLSIPNQTSTTSCEKSGRLWAITRPKPRFLETVVGKGDRFIGPVRLIDACYPNSNFEHRYQLGLNGSVRPGGASARHSRCCHCFSRGLLPMIRALGLPMHWFRALEICKVWTFCRLRRY
jgi:DNA-binding winged helix-turn-helix (wHTH) protein